MAKTEKAGDNLSDGKWESEVMVPIAPGGTSQIKVAPRVGALDGKKVGLFWNIKPNGDVFLLRIGQRLKEKFPSAEIIEFLPAKPVAGRPSSATTIEEAVRKCDVVILSTGD